MSNVVTSTKPRFSALLWFGLLLNLLFAAYVLSSLHILLRYKREFKVDEDIFRSNVQLAVSNFLSGVVSSSSSPSASTDFSVPKVVLVPGLGFGSSPVRGDFVLIDGGRYKVGDYCSHGLIISIRDDRAYCRSGDEICILRSCPVQVVPAIPPAPLPSAGPSGDGKGQEESGFLGLRL